MPTLCPSGTKKLGAAAICDLFCEGENRGPAGAVAIRRLDHVAN
jgi:hypothetical protein